MGRRIAHAWGRRQLFSLMVMGLGLGVVVVATPAGFCLGCVGSLVAGELGFVLGGVLGFGGVVTLAVGGILLWGAMQSRRRATRLDEVFRTLGDVRPTAGGLVHRSWEGTLASGRTVQARLDRGPSVGLRVTSSVRTRAGIGRDSGLGQGVASAVGRQVVAVPGADGLVIGAREPGFAEALAERPGLGEDLTLLLHAPSPQLRSVSIGPGYVALSTRYQPVEELDAERVQRWTDALCRLAEHAESLPVDEPVEPGAIERAMVDDPAAFRTRVTLLTLGGFGCFALLLFAIGAVFFAVVVGLQ